MVAMTTSSVGLTSAASTSAGTPTAEAAGAASANVAPATDRRVSRAKLRANRRNAQKSTGPRTPQGKARSARNSTSHGIFCRDLLLEGEDPELFRMTRESFLRALKPQDAVQLAMVDGAMSARWRLNRCQHAEADVIARRTARARKLVAQRFGTLSRNMRCEDFSAVALAAQCGQSEVFRRHYEQWKELRACERAAMHPGHAIAALMEQAADQPLERLSRYEQRLEQTFHRCLRDLHVLKQRAKEYADEPESPFLGGTVPGDNALDAAPDADDAAGRGLGVPPEHSGAATNPSTDEAEAEDALGRDAQATQEVAEPAVQNEPTVAEPVASAGPAEGCGEVAGPPPDPREMAELRKITEMLTRCRPDPVGDDDEDAYDE